MECKPHEYELKNFTKLPLKMLFNFSNELSELKALQVIHHPFFSDEKYELIVKFLISSLTNQLDAEYEIASSIYDILNRYYPHECISNKIEQEKVEQCLSLVAHRIFMRLIDTRVYLGGVFPYFPESIQPDGGVLFCNSKYLNYETELLSMDKPFQFIQY